MIKSLRDPFSGLSHLAGALLAIAGVIFLLMTRWRTADLWFDLSISLYGASLIGMYLSSSAYHLLPVSPQKTSFLRRLDHMCIYLLIAGTYSPFCLVSLRDSVGFSVFCGIWSVAVVGCLLKIFWFNIPRWFNVALYVLMGWGGVVLAFAPMLCRQSATWRSVLRI